MALAWPGDIWEELTPASPSKHTTCTMDSARRRRGSPRAVTWRDIWKRRCGWQGSGTGGEDRGQRMRQKWSVAVHSTRSDKDVSQAAMTSSQKKCSNGSVEEEPVVTCQQAGRLPRALHCSYTRHFHGPTGDWSSCCCKHMTFIQPRHVSLDWAFCDRA